MTEILQADGTWKHSVRKLNYRHEAIIDYMIANPEMKQGEIAERLGLTQGYLSRLKSSDAFQREYRRRLNQHQEDLDRGITQKLYNVAEKGLDVVIDALDGEDVDPRFALDAKDKALSRLGYGGKNGYRAGEVENLPPPAASREDLEAARALIHEAKDFKETLDRDREEKVINHEEIVDGKNQEEGESLLGQEVEGEEGKDSAQEGQNNTPSVFFLRQGKGQREDEGGEEV